MGLDCNTKLGRQWIARQAQIAKRFAATREYDVIMTNDTTFASIDAIFSRTFIEAIAEIKGRDLTLDELNRFSSYLITFDKLAGGRALAQGLRVPYFVIVGLADGRIVYWKICDADGNWQTNFNVRRSETKTTCNDEHKIERANAYLSLASAKMIEAEVMEELPF